MLAEMLARLADLGKADARVIQIGILVCIERV
jgi:hypothetical protein